jgi:tRNA uridine 5-carboxymethylaminomethyl modification enzyme
MDKVRSKKEGVEKIKNILNSFSVAPDEINSYFEIKSSSLIIERQKASKLLLRPEIELNDLTNALPGLEIELNEFSTDIIEQASIQMKYAIYIEKEKSLLNE